MKHQSVFSLFWNIFSILMMTIMSVSVEASASADIYESDNTLQNAKAILLYDSRPEFAGLGYDWTQSHNFYDSGDEDWVKFYALKDWTYTLEVRQPGSKCDAVIGIYDKFGDLVIAEERNPKPAGNEEQIQFECQAEGIYYARIRQSGSAEYGENTDYKLVLFMPYQNADGCIEGSVTPCVTEIIIKSTGCVGILVYGKDNDTCKYSMPHQASSPPDSTFKLTATAEGYEPYENDITVKEIGNTKVDIELKPINNEPPKFHSADYNRGEGNYKVINLPEMLRVQQLYGIGSYHCDSTKEDGYAPGDGDRSCTPHNSDYKPQDWKISLNEFSRIIQFWNLGGYHSDPSGEDRFAPGK